MKNESHALASDNHKVRPIIFKIKNMHHSQVKKCAKTSFKLNGVNRAAGGHFVKLKMDLTNELDHLKLKQTLH